MLTSLTLIFLLGILLGAIFKRLGLPSLIGMLIGGILLSPHVLNLLDPSILAISADLRELALIIILTRAGLSLDIADLRKIGRPAVLMSFVPACFEMAATIALAPWLFGISLLDAAILAAVIASASPAVIVPRMIRLIDEGWGADKNIPQLIMTGDSVDDVFNICVFTSLLGLSRGEKISAVRFAEIPISIVTGIAAGMLIGLVLSKLFKLMKARDSVLVLIILSAAFLLAALEGALKGHLAFSGLIGVMAAGVSIYKLDAPLAGRLSAKLSKLWVGAEVLLFVLVGAQLDITYAASAGVKTLLMLAVILSARAAGILLCLLRTNLNARERLFCTFTGIPKATVQAAIGGIPLAMGMASGELILAVAVVTILVSAPLGAMLIDRTYKRLLEKG